MSAPFVLPEFLALLFTREGLAALASPGVILFGVAMLLAACLRVWRDWQALRRQERDLAARSPVEGADTPMASAGIRIEMADLKERVRKLERTSRKPGQSIGSGMKS